MSDNKNQQINAQTPSTNPKKKRYVELIKGLQWEDDISGIRLSRGKNRLTGRMEKDRNNDKELEGYGVVDFEPHPVVEVPHDADIRRIEAAIKHRILRWYDPQNPPKNKVDPDEDTSRRGLGQRSKDFEFDNRMGKLKFTGSNREAYRILQLSMEETVKTIERIKDLYMLEDIMKYEQGGYNRRASPRFEVVAALKKQLERGDLRNRSNIKTKDEETVKVT